MFFYTLLGLLLDNKEFKLFHIDFPAIFNSIGAVFKIALVGMIGGFFKIGEAIYAVFESLAFATDIFDKSIFSRIATNMYSIFGVVILFISAYNFLMYIVDPEKNSGDMSIEKMLKNVAKVFIIIVLLPTVFSLANGFVGSIVEGGVIENLIFGSETNKLDCEDTYSNLGIIKNSAEWTRLTEKNKNNRFEQAMADIFASFFTYDNASPETIKLTPEDNFYFPRVCCPGGCDKTCTLQDTIDAVKCTGRYGYYFNYGANWTIDDNTHFKFEFFLALLSICYVIYVLVSFCFDLAVRSIKLAFYQIVAPLCVGCSILPGPKKEIYSKWKSLTIKTYVAVFIRIFAMSLGVLFISSISSLMDNLRLSTRCDGFCSMLVKLFLILGILTFIKQMPKIIDELLGEDSGLGQTVRDKFKQAGGLALGAAAGAAAVGLGKGVANHVRNHKGLGSAIKQKHKKAQEFRDKAREKGYNPFNYFSRRAFKKTEDGRTAYNAKRDADKALHKKQRSMFTSLAGIGLGTASATMRSIGKSTNGFGLNGVKEDLKAMGANASQSAAEVDARRERHSVNADNRGKLYESLRKRWQAKQNINALNNDIKKLEDQLILATDASVRASLQAKIDEKKAKIDKIDVSSLNSAIKDATLNTMTADLLQKIKVNVQTTFSPDQSAQLKAKEELYKMMEQNEKDLKQDGQNFLQKFGSNIKMNYKTSINKICGEGTPSSIIAMGLLEEQNYREVQAELDSLLKMNDAEFTEHLKSRGIDVPEGINIANLKTQIQGAVPGLKSEIEKVTIAKVSDVISTGKGEDVFIDGKAGNLALSSNDGLKLAASIEITNQGYNQAYPGSNASDSDSRKTIKERSEKDLIQLSNKTAAAQNSQNIAKAKNQGTSK